MEKQCESGTVPVVFALDDGYAMPTAVAIYTMLKNYTRESMQIVFLFKGALSSLTKALLESAAEPFRSTITVEYRYIDVADSVEFPDSHISHITSATYYRLVLPELLDSSEKCLYLDGDIYVNGDISELMSYEFQGEELIAGVRSTTTETAMPIVKKRKREELGIQDLSGYINAGVILMNLEGMRQCGAVKKMLDLIPRNFRVQDQDIINVVCCGRIKNVHPKYNALPDLFRKSKQYLAPVYSESEITEARETPCIIHYADAMKPWRYSNISNGAQWRAAYSELFGRLNMQSNHYGLKDRISRAAAFIRRIISRGIK